MTDLNPVTVSDYGPGFSFHAYCSNEVNCKHHKQLTGLAGDVNIDDLAKRMVCSKCGLKGVVIQRVCFDPMAGRR